ncbi:hypothetical protein SASPL_122390 [Salvia splendens]|uniref:U-box domain-containing protein n=2 Tax=Salvia splendens TaxID=180675 RepID=A0A8X8XP66_SALSN|nr:hypothetical protein SASPL_122390 [Salvia splendens]
MPAATFNLEPLDISLQIPHHFRCPISLELMRDPVTLSSGQTYDRSSIDAWLATGNTTCPVTRQPLMDFNLIPNHTLRRLIQDWCVSNRSFGVERIPTPKQPAEPVLVRSLLRQAASGPYGVRASSLRKLRSLARESDKNRIVIAANNAREVMMSIAFADVGSDLRHDSLAVLSVLALTEEECVSVGSDPDRIGFLVNLLFHSSIDVRVNSAAVIESVVAGIRSPELRAEISGAEGVFGGIVGILNYPFIHPRGVKVGIKALFALCLAKQHRGRAVAAGAVEALVERLAEVENCGDAERALATVELLCRIPAGCAAFEAHALTVPLLVKVTLKVSGRATEYAAGALLALCSASERAQRDAVAAGVVTQLLLVVQSDCTERAKRKAQMLLKLLRSSWSDAYVVKTEDFAGSDVVLF